MEATKEPKNEELSGVTIVILIGASVMTFIILFIFAKRQIMRFTLRSRPWHVGHDVKKSIKREIERRLDQITKIAFEPILIWEDSKYILLHEDQQNMIALPPYYYRQKAVDDVKLLEREIQKQDGSVRHPRDSLRAFLISSLAAPLNCAGQKMIHQFCDMYEHARHDPNEFQEDEYREYHRLFMKLIDAAKMLKTFSRKSSPSRTPKKQVAKMQSLLDPARLVRPVGGGQNDTLNRNISMSLGLGQLDDQELGENEIMSIAQYHGEN